MLKVFLFSLFSASAIILGAWLGTKGISRSLKCVILAFGSGIIISIISSSLVPAAYRMAGIFPASAAFLLGGAFYLSLDSYISRSVNPGLGTALGSMMDDLPEALSLGIGFLSDSGSLGLIMTLSIFLHNLPEGLAVTSEMLDEGHLQPRQSMAAAGLLALLTPVGAVSGYGLLRNIDPLWPGASMGFASGAMLYMLIEEIIPKVHREGKPLHSAGTLVGFLTSYLISTIIGTH